jgi:hypothetical protein
MVLSADRMAAAEGFWYKKGQIYARFINHPAVIAWESRCSAAIRQRFSHLSMGESFEISEAEVLSYLRQAELPALDTTVRYKPPRVYAVVHPQGPVHERDYPLESLRDIFTSWKMDQR